jgi:glucose/mannose transport system substrate-binding protein
MATAIEKPEPSSRPSTWSRARPRPAPTSRTTAFDDCGKKAIKDLAEANTNGTLFGSMAHGHANPASVKNAIYDVITRQFNGELDLRGAVTELVRRRGREVTRLRGSPLTLRGRVPELAGEGWGEPQ